MRWLEVHCSAVQLAICTDVSLWPWPWSLRPKSLSLALALMPWSCSPSPWPWPWMFGMTIYLTQATSEKKIPCCTGVMVSAGSGNMYRHMVMALFTYHLSRVSNLHLILGNLFLVRLDVGSWPGHKVLGLGCQVLVNITGCLYTTLSQTWKLLELL